MVKRKKKSMKLHYAWLAALLAVVLFFGKQYLDQHNADSRQNRVIIETQQGERYAFSVEVARSEQEKIQGLMNREDLPSNHGMLFLYRNPQAVDMWMKDTKLGLDMIFIAADNTIHKIMRSAAPYSTDTISSEGEVVAVLEISAGLADSFGMKEGDKVTIETKDTTNP